MNASDIARNALASMVERERIRYEQRHRRIASDSRSEAVRRLIAAGVTPTEDNIAGYMEYLEEQGD